MLTRFTSNQAKRRSMSFRALALVGFAALVTALTVATGLTLRELVRWARSFVDPMPQAAFFRAFLFEPATFCGAWRFLAYRSLQYR